MTPTTGAAQSIPVKGVPGAGATLAERGTSVAVWLAFLGAVVPVVCIAIPMYVIRPFRPQDPSQLAAALWIRGIAPWVSAASALMALLVVFWAWRSTSRLWPRLALVVLSVVAVVAAGLTNINIFEIMFHPYPSPAFAGAASVSVDADDKVLAVKIGGEAHAYPIRTMGYHHIVNDVVGNQPIAVTYCTLCHTGLVWNRILNGATLRFRLAGINNGNALMRDENTNSIWQQSTGQAIFGPLKGQQLGLIHSDELTFVLWRKEQPAGLVLKPDAPFQTEYESKDWEKHVEGTKTVVDTRKSGIAPHELMFGITVAGESKAYPLKSILAAKVIQDGIASVPIVLVVGPDRASIRVFRANFSGSSMTFLSKQLNNTPANTPMVVDAETNSTWSFQGCAIEGPLTGRCLEPLDGNKDYWFDWMNHHPGTAVFKS